MLDDLKFKRGFVEMRNGFFDNLQNNSEYGKEFFSNFFICNIHHSFDTIILGCKSTYFDEVDDGLKVPFYEILFIHNEDYVPSIHKVEKLNKYFL